MDEAMDRKRKRLDKEQKRRVFCFMKCCQTSKLCRNTKTYVYQNGNMILLQETIGRRREKQGTKSSADPIQWPQYKNAHSLVY